MARRMNWALIGPVICLTLLSGETRSQEPDPPDEAAPEVLKTDPINSGYVILDGRYLPPPYTLEERGDSLWVNDRLAIADWFARPVARNNHDGPPRGGRGPERWAEDEETFAPPPRADRDSRRRGPPRRGQWGWAPASPQRPTLARLERDLKRECFLLGGSTIRGCLLTEDEATSVLATLTTEFPAQDRVQILLDDLPDQMDEADWLSLIQSFQPSEELMARIGPRVARLREVMAENYAQHRAIVDSVFWTSRPVKYLITLMAMGLVVAACGTLLNHRPTARAAWTEIDTAGEGIPIVVRSVVLLILLGVFDLGCTLIAQQAGGFTEMNPLGQRLAGAPLLLTAFKLATLLGACGILYALRRYRGAQVAAWWMCILCTVLTFRWLTYNSMFMT
ncbi:MAG: hypothetical protein GXX96_12165 [Planctomycetaceae bacterium]|nr:hypothetical protein [Planctomycetaceae bacterium]